MRRIARYFFISSILCLSPFSAKSQSTVEFQSGTQIEVTTGADICADNIVINGTYTGGGTQCGGPLPVELISFTVISHRSFVELNWRTAAEMNNYGFEIERCTAVNRFLEGSGSLVWSKAGFVEGNGTTNAPKEYSFIDKNLSAGNYSYRLKQIDRDGKFEYSQSVEVTIIGTPKEFTLEQNYPNPFNPSTMINYQLPITNHVTLKVYNAIGREVATLVNEEKEAGLYSAMFDAKNLSSGIYFAKLQYDEKYQLKKMLLLK